MRSGKRRYLLLADEDLVSLVAGGDARAFAALYDRHARATLSLARRLSPAGGEQDAEDLVQTAFLGVWRSAGTYRAERGSFRTWLLPAVRNASVDGLRSAAKHRRARERVGATAEMSRPCEAFAEVWRGAVRERLQETLEALPPEQLEVLRLAYVSGYAQSEASELLGVPLRRSRAGRGPAWRRSGTASGIRRRRLRRGRGGRWAHVAVGSVATGAL